MSNRTIGTKGLDLIVSFEKEVLHVYDDGFGYPTLGVGHLLTSSEKAAMPVGTKITKEQSREYFRKDLKKYIDAVNAAVKVHITQNQFDAMVSLCFNIGVGGFAKSSLVRKLNAGDYAKAADAFLAWNKAKGKVVKGLTRRRNAERDLFHTPDPKTSAAASSDRIEGALSDESTGADTTSAVGAESPDSSQDQPPTLPTTPVVVEKEETPGFFANIKLKLGGWIASLGGLTGLTQYKQQVDDLGLPGWIIGYALGGAVAAFILWLLYEGVKHLIQFITKRMLTTSLIAANATPLNTVIVACKEDLDKYEALGYKVVRRQ